MSDIHPMPAADAIAEGARARALGRPTDSCPHPMDSDARNAWMEGYDGVAADRALDHPMDNG